MKKTTKALAAAAAVLLIAAVFVGAGAAADVNISVDKNGLVNLWTNDTTSYKHYWTIANQAIEIPFNVTGDSTNKYLAGYVVTFAGNLTDVTGAAFKNASTVWSEKSLAVNGKTIAKAADAGGILDIQNGNRTFKIAVTPTSKGYYNVTLVNLAANFSATAKNVADLTSYTDVPAAIGANLNTSAGFFADKNFVIYVRDRVNNTKFTFPDYNTAITAVDGSKTVYLYYEHELAETGDAKRNVSVNATMDKTYDTNYDTNAWVLDSGSSNFSVVSSVNPADTTVLSNVINIKSPLAGEARSNTTWDGLLNLTINEKIGAAVNISKVKLNLSFWNPDTEKNDGVDTYNSATKWSFVTPLIQNYTIRAGPVDTSVDGGWNTSVVFENLTGRTNEVQLIANVSIYDGDTLLEDTYLINGLTAVNGTKQLTSGDNVFFKIDKNAINDGTKTLTIFMKGYRLGDANIDDKVDIVDSAVVGITVLKGADEAAGLTFLPAQNRIYADCNSQGGSGTIDVADILAINTYLVGSNPWAGAPS